MLHGFTGSPNEMLELGEFLTSKNLTITIPTLPGHGTHSGDLFNYSWRDWFDAAKAAHAELRERCEEVFVCGLSMGGALALHLAAHAQMQGVIALAAAIKFPDWKRRLVRALKRVMPWSHKRGGEDVKDDAAKVKLGSYRRFPLYAADQLFRLGDHVREDLPEVQQPILIMHSKKDHTVPFSCAELIFNSVGSEDKRKVDLEESYHVITVDVEKERVKEEVWQFIQTHSKLLTENQTKPRAKSKAQPRV